MTLMVGLDSNCTNHKSLQMQFFWRYLSRLQTKNNEWGGFGDTNSLKTSEYNYSAAKSSNESPIAGDTSPVAFEQTMTFFYRLTALEEALSTLVFEYVAKQRVLKREHVDFNNISRHLHQAVFLQNDVMMFERMPAQQMLLHTNEHDIVGLAAFVLRAVYQELLFLNKGDKSWRLPDAANAIIDDFEDKFHLSSSLEVFSDSKPANGSTLQTLKTILTEIDEQTPFKSPDYEDYYDALSGVLKGQMFTEDSLMPAYNEAWEELCVFHYKQLCAADNSNVQIVWCDNGSISFSFSDLNKSKVRSLNKEIFKDIRSRWPSDSQSNDPVIEKRPDLVLRYSCIKYEVVDFKHYNQSQRQNLLSFNETKERDIEVQEHESVRSLAFYARAVDTWHNPYGKNGVPLTKKTLCFPESGRLVNPGSTEYFSYEFLSTEDLMTKYIEQYS